MAENVELLFANVRYGNERSTVALKIVPISKIIHFKVVDNYEKHPFRIIKIRLMRIAE